MDSSTSQLSQRPASGPGGYLNTYDRALIDQYALRTADRQAGFLLRHLRPGMSLLDCGCGPGSITIDLAERLAPGKVVGIDIAPGQVQQAQATAAGKGVRNVRFQVSDVYALPFEDGSFDSALLNAVVLYLADPVAALREVYRVLRPGGVVGVRDPDHFFGAPVRGPVERSIDLYVRVAVHNGLNPYFTRTLRGPLQEIGFVRCAVSASCESWGDAEAVKVAAEKEARRVETALAYRQAVELGFTDQQALEQLGADIRAWGERSDAFLSIAYSEAVGWKQG